MTKSIDYNPIKLEVKKRITTSNVPQKFVINLKAHIQNNQSIPSPLEEGTLNVLIRVKFIPVVHLNFLNITWLPQGTVKKLFVFF